MLQINNDNVFSDSRDEKSLSEENKRLLYILKSAGIKEWNGTERIVSILEDIQLRVPYLLAGFPKNLFAVIEQLFQVPYPLFYRPLIWWKDNSFYLMKVCSVGFGDEVFDRTLTCCKTLLLQIEYVGALVRPAFTYLYLKKEDGFYIDLIDVYTEVDTITLGDRFINRRREELIYPLSSCLQEFSQLTEQISLLIDSPRIPGVTTSYVFRTFGRREGKEQRQLQEKGQNTAQQLLRKKEQQELTVAERRRTFEIYISAEEQKRVTRVCKNFTFDPFYREDNGQEILIDIFKYICSYDPERPIRSWVYKVAVNKLSDLHLRNNRIKYSADREMEEFEDKAEYVVKEFELSLAKPSLYSNSIQKCLYQLKPVLRDTFLLKEAGFKIREIAAIHYKEGQLLTNNMETVKSRLYCARKKMKEFLINEGY